MATFQEHKAPARRFPRPPARFPRPSAWALILAAVCLAPLPAAAQKGAPLVPGVGTDDRRQPVNPASAPWDSLVKVQSELGNRCTGALVGPGLVVTAAHCTISPRTRGPMQPSSLHVLFGYDRGQYRGHARVRAVVSGPGYDPARPLDVLPVDWAVLVLDGGVPTGVPVLPLDTAPARGQPMALGGYSQDRAQILMADTACSLMGRQESPLGALLVHDCDGTRGTSGGPLLAWRDGGWAVAGVNVAVVTGEGRRRNLAVPASSFAFALR